MTKHLLQVEAISPMRRDETEQGMGFHQDLSIQAALDLESEFGIEANTELNLFFWVEANDPAATILLSSYYFTPSSRLALMPGDTQHLTLSFDIPAQAEPGIYPYTIVFKVEQALEKTVRVPLQLEILPVQPASRVKALPAFEITPVTSESQPSSLQSGQAIAFKILVENRSSASDLFYLTFPTLPKEWFTLKYVDYGAKIRGIVQPATGLRLDPHEQGEILLKIHPPHGTRAGNYSFALQLISMNHPDLGLADEIHLQLLPDDRIYTELRPDIQSIQDEAQSFTLKLINRGNLSRQFKLDVRDSHRLFSFFSDRSDTPSDSPIEIDPGAEATLTIEAMPRRWWQRPWGRKPKKVQVSFNLIPLETDPALASLIAPQARLIWQPYPLWLQALVLLGGTSAIALLSLFILYRFNRPPSPPLEIMGFRTSATRAETEGYSIQLNWRMSYPGSLDRIEIARIEEGAETAKQTHNFKAGIPVNLKAKTDLGAGCRSSVSPASPASSFALWQLPLPPIPGFSSLQQPAPPTTMIDCQSIPFAVPEPGLYRFRLKLFAQDNSVLPAIDQTTDAIAVQGTTNRSPLDPKNEPRSLSQAPSNSIPEPTEIVSFTVDGESVLSQPTRTFTVSPNSERVPVNLAWAVKGENVSVQLLPAPGEVPIQGTKQYWLRSGSVYTLTLVAGSRFGEQVTQTVVLQAVSPPKPLEPTPSPTPSSSPESIQETPNDPAIDASPSPDASSEPSPEPVLTP